MRRQIFRYGKRVIEMNKHIIISAFIVCLFLTGCAKADMVPPAGQLSSTPVSSASSLETAAAPTPAPNWDPTQSPGPTPGPNIADDPISVQLLSILAEYTEDEIVFFQHFPIGDGQYAAFAVVKRYGGAAWYVTASGARKLQDVSIGELAPFLWTVDGVTILKCENMGGSSTHSFAWYVKDGIPIELPYRGMCLTYMGDGQFLTIGEDFDAVFQDETWRGHTYKVYYLYWENDGLVEYGGLEITRKQLLEVSGAQEILDTITNAGYTIDEIYYRDNHIITINYHTGGRQNDYYYDNVTLIYDGKTVTPKWLYSNSEPEDFNEDTLDDYSYGGSYQAAYYPQIAVYPDTCPLNWELEKPKDTTHPFGLVLSWPFFR